MLAVGQDSQARFVELQRPSGDVIVGQVSNQPPRLRSTACPSLPKVELY